MNIRISIVIFILLSFFSIGATSNNVVSNKNSFNVIETNMKNISDFEENGVKLQYRTKNNIKNEIFRIKEILKSNVNGNYRDIEETELEVVNDDFNIDAKMWNEDKYNYCEITLTNKNSKYTTAELKNILQRIQNLNSEDVQYFAYYMGKYIGIEEDFSINELMKKNSIEKIKLLKISNGYTGTGYLRYGDKINFALVKYNTGSHIIIGTPIIFTTY